MIRAIVYDAVGTLIHVNPSVATIYAEVGRRFGSRLETDEIGRRFPAAFVKQEQIDRALGWRTDEPRERQRWAAIVREVLDDVAEPAACFEALFHEFGQSHCWACDAEAEGVLTEMHKRGCVQALASNFDARLRVLIRAMPALRVLDPILISSQVGWRKPAPQFFAQVAESLQLPARDILFVGDDRGNDFDGARHSGMRALLLDPKRKHLDVAERVECLTDLLVQ